MLNDERVRQMRSDKMERRGLMAALDASQALIWFDAAGRIVDANDNALTMFGYSIDDLLQRSYSDLIHAPTRQDHSYQRLWERIQTGQLRNEERSYYTASGSEVWTSANFAAITNEFGLTRRVLAILIDLSPWSWKPKDAARLAL
jgi:methyl-accepting chemotaxis protein